MNDLISFFFSSYLLFSYSHDFHLMALFLTYYSRVKNWCRSLEKEENVYPKMMLMILWIFFSFLNLFCYCTKYSNKIKRIMLLKIGFKSEIFFSSKINEEGKLDWLKIKWKSKKKRKIFLETKLKEFCVKCVWGWIFGEWIFKRKRICFVVKWFDVL